MRSATLTIVFTDIKGFTARTSQSTREENKRLIAAHSQLLSPLFRAFGGRIIKEIGDAFLVTFASPTTAVLAGTAVQDRLWQYNRGVPDAEQIDVRVALSIGEVQLQGGDIFGEPVNLAARVEALAEAGEVWFTEGVYLAMNKAEVPAEEVGVFALRGIPNKVRLYRVPKAPYRVDSTERRDILPLDAPPYGNLGLNKMPNDPAARALAATGDFARYAVKTATGVVSGGEYLFRTLVRPRIQPLRPSIIWSISAAVAALVGWLSWPSEADRAIAAVAETPRGEERSLVKKAQATIAKENERGRRELLSGRLALATGHDVRAIEHLLEAHRAGEEEAEEELIGLLRSDECQRREDALEGIRRLMLRSARTAVEALAEEGGLGDGERVGLFGRCDSRETARSVLRALEEGN